MSREIHEVIAGSRTAFCVGAPTALPSDVRYVVPGSFAPLHRGHRGMAEYVSQKYHDRVDFELSIENVDKRPLIFDEVSNRLTQFDSERIWLTRAATFAEKAMLFPNCRFIIGADTAVRLFQPRYYGGDSALSDAIAVLRDQACRFIVFGRFHEGQFVSAPSLPVPDSVVHLFELVPQDSFRIDISSTELRRESNRD